MDALGLGLLLWVQVYPLRSDVCVSHFFQRSPWSSEAQSRAKPDVPGVNPELVPQNKGVQSDLVGFPFRNLRPPLS